MLTKIAIKITYAKYQMVKVMQIVDRVLFSTLLTVIVKKPLSQHWRPQCTESADSDC